MAPYYFDLKCPCEEYVSFDSKGLRLTKHEIKEKMDLIAFQEVDEHPLCNGLFVTTLKRVER